MSGAVLTLLIVALAVLGRFVAPFGENEVAGPPFSKDGVFGTDYLGQDVLSRLLYGGQIILTIAVLGTLLGMVVGVLIGVVAAYAGGWWDEVIMRLNDVTLAFPQILLALVILTAVDQPRTWMIVVLIGVSHAPRVARVARGVALGLVSRDFVHAAEALGERRSRVILAEVLPNMNAPLLAEAGLRLTYSIGLVAALGFLGFSTDPDKANWGQMINENRLAISTQPWAVLAPVLIIGLTSHPTDVPAGGGITVSDLRIGLTGRPGVDVVDDIDLVLRPGEVVGLVGESGSGKTTVGTSLLGYTRAGALIERGKVLFEDRDVLGLPWQQVRQLRGEEIAYVPQDPASALNPSIRIGRQIVELMELRGLGTPESRLQGARDGLAEVGLPNDDEFLRRYAHQLSGGQVQRVALAMAFLPRPKVLVLDEPTTGLDVTTQGMVLSTMGELCRSHGVAALYVTHDLAVVANIADRVAVMYAGQVAELGDRETIFAHPSHPYTRALLDSIPHLSQARALSGIPGRTPAPGSRPGGCRFHDRCAHAVAACAEELPQLREVAPGHQVRCLRAEEIGAWDISRGTVPDADPAAEREVILDIAGLDVRYGRTQVVFDVGFDVARAEVVALVGESGSGKTTISRCVGGLHKEWSGSIDFEGRPLGHGARKRSAADRKRIQYIFQNPYLSLNPRLSVEQIVKRPMELFKIASGSEATDRVADLLEQVALGPAVMRHQANRLSGGERQRVAIARALAAEPDLLVCDEITSALDVSVQGSIVALLEELRLSRGISMLFVTHNLALVRSIAARVQILSAGRVVESGPVAQVMDHPQEEYTRRLLANSPRID
ncbi:hypothetical protein LUZ63_020273 [Rhynchospora breviuscula]|uniref:Nickel import system ATP-binding protein NikD n=1 Tax=Rhynchospora breviuscula TaxID=2022672 RepID=A0A9P9Z910_9POAL|nr:hypothetical protein LUZ63_020273 [Rhynchospora breviuscula]